MPNKNYVNGRRFEYKVKRYMEQMGYYVVRSGGSHGMADLVCIRSVNDPFIETHGGTMKVPEVLLIQCKLKKELLSAKEKEEFRDLADKLSGQAWLAYSEKRKIKCERLN